MLCYKTIELSSGRAALTDHAKGMKHDFLLKISTFFTPAKKTDKCEKEDKSNQNKKQQTLDTCVMKSNIL